MISKNILIAIIILVIGIAGYFLFAKQQNQNWFSDVQNSTKSTAVEDPVSLNQKDQQELESFAFAAVDQKTKGQWDKKIDVRSVDKTKNAVEGGWWAKDRWHWIAWRQTGGNWNILISLDGFDCKELETIPAQYKDFFRELLYMPSGDKYCYSHTF